MAALIRMIFGIILSAFIARIVEGLMTPKQKLGPQQQPPQGKPIPTLDLKPCPVCGTYTAQPATHCSQ